jgi:pimeloyl-ACP methyl ester carboxylesterase
MIDAVRRTSEAFVKANGLSICYQAFGEPADPVVVLIMGMGAQMVGWDEEFCERLASRGFCVIRLDNRDAGRSTRLDHAGVPDIVAAMTRAWLRVPVNAPYLLGDMALDVVGLLDALKIDSAHVVGASMGGTIGQEMAMRHSRRVRSLTSIMSTTGDPDLPQPRPWALRALFAPTPLERDAYIEYYAKLWRMLRGGSYADEEARDRARAARNYARGLNPAGAARQLTAILASGSRRRALRQVTAPTLVIHGDADPLVPLAAGTDTAASIPGAELMVLEGMGHALPMPMWPRIIDGIVRVAGRR